MKIVISFIFLFVSHFVFSQNKEAIIYFKDGTSIEGLGMIKKVSSFSSFQDEDKILFRITADDKPDEWTYEDIKGITFINFESTIKLEYIKFNDFDKPILLELVTNGNVNLYKKIVLDEYYSSGVNPKILLIGVSQIRGTPISKPHLSTSFKSQIYYLKREDEVYPTKIGDNFIKKSAKYFSDCELLVKKIKSHEYDLENLDEMVNFYNDICSD